MRILHSVHCTLYTNLNNESYAISGIVQMRIENGMCQKYKTFRMQPEKMHHDGLIKAFQNFSSEITW